jgi:DNA-binding SARP family transcriptional activator
LLVSPYDERLYRMLMRAADLSGNPAGVESAMAELIRLVAEDVEPLDSVHPATMDLYRSLTRHRTSPTLRPRGPEDL